MKKEHEIPEEIKELIKARIMTLPSNLNLSFGSGKDYNKEELLQNIEKETVFGKLFVNMQLKYLRNLKNYS